MMEIYFKYNAEGCELTNPFQMDTNCYLFYYGKRDSVFNYNIKLRCISTYSVINDWWEVLGYIEINNWDNFNQEEESIQAVSLNIGGTIPIRNKAYLKAQQIFYQVMMIYRRDYRLNQILN